MEPLLVYINNEHNLDDVTDALYWYFPNNHGMSMHQSESVDENAVFDEDGRGYWLDDIMQSYKEYNGD